jgi:hypothetical protein
MRLLLLSIACFYLGTAHAVAGFIINPYRFVVVGGGSTLLTSLWAWYEMAETTNTDDAVDSSPNGRTWTRLINMTPDATSAPDGGACRVSTSNGTPLSRDGENTTNGNSISLSFWIRTVTTMGNGNVLFFDNNTSNHYNLGVNIRGLTTYRIYINNTSVASTALATALVANTWNHLALTYNSASTVATVWSNGVKQTTTGTGTPSTTTLSRLQIANGASGQKLTGVAVWTKVLSDAEIAELYNGGVNLRFTDL